MLTVGNSISSNSRLITIIPFYTSIFRRLLITRTGRLTIRFNASALSNGLLCVNRLTTVHYFLERNDARNYSSEVDNRVLNVDDRVGRSFLLIEVFTGVRVVYVIK